jgi:hypothetical protein
MDEQFVPYELALKLKEKGFDEPCLGYYREDAQKKDGTLYEYITPYHYDEVKECEHMIPVFAPLYQQAMEWFDDKYNIIFSRNINYTIKNCDEILHIGHNYKLVRVGMSDKLIWTKECSTRLEAKEEAIKHALTLI